MLKSIDPAGYGMARVKVEYLMKSYEWFFSPLVGKGIKLLELGVFKGASLRFWRDYFENATIAGLDSSPIQIDDTTGMIHVYQGQQQDTHVLDRIAQEQAPEGFDVVIDDCSHIGRLARISFWHLFQNHLKPGGLYAIEDWETAYVHSPPDGRRYKRKPKLVTYSERLSDTLSKGVLHTFPHFPRIGAIPSRLFTHWKIPSHTYGMVGLITELLAECSIGEIAIPRSGSGRYLDYGITQIYINPWVVIVLKSTEQNSPKPGNTFISSDGSITASGRRLIIEEV